MINAKVGHLKVNKEGCIARRDGGTIVAYIKDVGWGEESTEIARAIVDAWNRDLEERLRKPAKRVWAKEIPTTLGWYGVRVGGGVPVRMKLTESGERVTLELLNSKVMGPRSDFTDYEFSPID